MLDKPICDVSEYIKISDKLLYEGGSLYRGQCCSSWSLESGIVRRIKKTYPGISEGGLLLSLIFETTEDLIKRARVNPELELGNECDLNVLAILQHYGAATPLLDFTREPLVALYFACQPYTEKGNKSDGKVFCINYSKQVHSDNVSIVSFVDPSIINIETIFTPKGHRGIWQWTVPEKFPCKRSKKQQSVFVSGWGLLWEYRKTKLVNELQSLTIAADSKKKILDELKDKYDISEQTLFPDVYGFAQSNRHDKIIQYFGAEDFYAKGEDADCHEWKAEFYKMAFEKRPKWIDARCKCIISLNHDGRQDEALVIVEDSINELGENWKLLVCKADTYDGLYKDWKPILNKAKQIAVEANEREYFELFTRKLLPLDSIFKIKYN
jgi:hypothetical protein